MWWFVDAALSTKVVGLIRAGVWLARAQTEVETLSGLFACAEQVDRASGGLGRRAAGLYWCSGPGRLLSLRIAAMACESWRLLSPVPWQLRCYDALQLRAAALLQAGRDPQHGTLCVPYKRGGWLALALGTGETLKDTRAVDAAALERMPGPKLDLEGQAGGAGDDLARAANDPESWLAVLDAVSVPVPPGAPLPVTQLQRPQFARWAGERHRAPG